MNSSTTPQDKKTLTDHLRSRSVSIIDPIVTFLARIGVSPDWLTILGMLLHILFAWMIASGQLFWAGIAILIFVPLDALDGSLARKIGRSGNFGAFLDSTSDRTAEIILYFGFMAYFWQQENIWLVVATYIAVSGSIMVSYARSRAEALDLECKVGLFSRVERYVVIVISLILSGIWPIAAEIGIVILAIGTWLTVIQRVHHVWKQTRPVN